MSEPIGTRDLSLSFIDPETTEVYTAVGPFRVVASRANGIDIEGYDPGRASAALVTVFADEERLWARMRVGNREFLTRLR